MLKPLEKLFRYLNDFYYWSKFLVELEKKTYDHDFRKSIEIFTRGCGDSVNKVNIGSFLSFAREKNIGKIYLDKMFKPNSEHFGFLNDFLHSIVTSPSIQFDPLSNTHNIIGDFVKFSDFVNQTFIKTASNIDIFARKGVFIDSDLVGTNFELFRVIAPQIETSGERMLLFDGADGEKDTSGPTDDGNGKPGTSGKSSGSFLMISQKLKFNKLLKVSVRGGQGGDGSDGVEKVIPYNLTARAPHPDSKCEFSSQFYQKTVDMVRSTLFIVRSQYTYDNYYTAHGGSSGYGGYPGNAELISDEPDFKFFVKRIYDGESGNPGKGGLVKVDGKDIPYVIAVCQILTINGRVYKTEIIAEYDAVDPDITIEKHGSDGYIGSPIRPAPSKPTNPSGLVQKFREIFANNLRGLEKNAMKGFESFLKKKSL